MLFSILGFIICSIVIIFHGSRLAKHGDTIAEHSGLGKAWFGLIFLSFVTTLPEFITGISSVIWIKAPDLALGNALGSGAYNLLLLAVLDLFIPGRPLTSLIQKSHLLSGALSMLLVLFITATLVFADQLPLIGGISVSTPLIFILYIVSIRILYLSEKQNQLNSPPPAPATSESRLAYKAAIRGYVLHALMVIAGALLMPWFADQLADETGLGRTFIGTLLIAATTSLPELVVSISSIRMKSYDLAVGNIFGANVFNMLLLGIEDMVYTGDSLFRAADATHIITGFTVIAMTIVASVGILTGVPGKKFTLAWDAVALFILYAFLSYLLYISTR